MPCSDAAPASTSRRAAAEAPSLRKATPQAVYEIASFIFEHSPEPSAFQLALLRQSVAALPLSCLGVSPPDPSAPATPGAPPSDKEITYRHIYEDERVGLGIFQLPAGTQIPLHNHPGMTVLSRVLYGDLHISSYDWASPEEASLRERSAAGAAGRAAEVPAGGASPSALASHEAMRIALADAAAGALAGARAASREPPRPRHTPPDPPRAAQLEGRGRARQLSARHPADRRRSVSSSNSDSPRAPGSRPPASRSRSRSPSPSPGVSPSRDGSSSSATSLDGAGGGRAAPMDDGGDGTAAVPMDRDGVDAAGRARHPPGLRESASTTALPAVAELPVPPNSRLAAAVHGRIFRASDAPVLLLPTAGGNMHCFRAVTDCAVVDVMAPPYSPAEGRDCTYYVVHPVDPSRSSGSPRFAWLESVEEPADASPIVDAPYLGTPVVRRPLPRAAASVPGVAAAPPATAPPPPARAGSRPPPPAALDAAAHLLPLQVAIGAAARPDANALTSTTGPGDSSLESCEDLPSPLAGTPAGAEASVTGPSASAPRGGVGVGFPPHAAVH